MLFLYSLLLSFVVAAPYCSPEDSNSNKKTIEIIQSTIVNPINSFCTDLKNIENNKDTLHKPICSIFWKNGQAWWKKAAEEKPETLNKDSKEYKNPSRNQMLAREYAIASPAELIKWEVEFKALKSRTAPLCCGQDSECAKAYLETPLKFCSDPKAEADPNAPDPCSKSKKAFFSVEHEALLGAWFYEKVNESPQDRLQLLAKIKKEIPNLSLEKIWSGYISLGKYKFGKDMLEPYIFRHELGHACNFVRRQIAAKKGTQDSLISFADDYNTVYCKPQTDAHANFRIIDQLLAGKNAVDLKLCIQDRIKNETQNPKDYAYVPGSCFGSKMEEATADAFSAFTAKPDEMTNLVYRLCDNAVSANHFSGYSTFECFIKNVPGFASQVSRGIACPN